MYLLAYYSLVHSMLRISSNMRLVIFSVHTTNENFSARRKGTHSFYVQTFTYNYYKLVLISNLFIRNYNRKVPKKRIKHGDYVLVKTSQGNFEPF